MISQSILVTIMLLLATAVNSVLLPAADCPTSCGSLNISFPFGTSSDCYLDDSFLITCNHSYNPPKPFLNLGTIEVHDISLDGLMKVSSPVASDCYDNSSAHINGIISELTLSKFPISSTRNKFVAVGCDTYALVKGSKERKQMIAGCISWCDRIDGVVNGTCSGIGCCQTSIPKGVKDFLVDIRSFGNHTKVNSFNPCSYAFVVEAEAFGFLSSDLKDLQNRKTVPVVLDWSVGNVTCQEARKNHSSYACRAIQSECSDSSNGLGYHCKCLTGFQGTPYLLDGCQDIDECTTLKPCEGICTNLLGNYSCSCPKGFEGDGKKDGAGCHQKSQANGSAVFYIVSGFMVPAVGSSWIFWRRKQKKLVKLRQNLFFRNGGVLLQESMQSGRTTFRVFKAEDLKKATDNYDENKILHRDHDLGITYKGILSDEGNREIIIRKCNPIEAWNTEIFIKQLVTLSHINHGNLVKMIGCCLETQVPLLVYDFISGKTLYDYLHDDGRASSLSWDIRLRIAAETAGAIACMHDSATMSIIHGNLNSSSILLYNGCYVYVKVHDFALTCSGVSDVLTIAGTTGYLDPEYFICSQLTEKSDVYSFGVVLAELLTGKKVISFDWLGGAHLSKYFVYVPRGEDLRRILDHRLAADNKIEQLTKVAKLATKCLSKSSKDRPTMREVVIDLENAINMNSSSTATGPKPNSTTHRVVRRN